MYREIPVADSLRGSGELEVDDPISGSHPVHSLEEPIAPEGSEASSTADLTFSNSGEAASAHPRHKRKAQKRAGTWRKHNAIKRKDCR
jgi:hypothetical protein